MKLIDISRSVLEAPKYPTAPKTIITQVDKIAEGKESNFSLVNTNAHAGTHADAFCHYVDHDTAIGNMSLDMYYGTCRVLSFPENTILSRVDFEGRLEGVKRVAIHGGGYTYLDVSAAEYLVSCGICCLLTDGWSPAPLDNEKQIHRTLFLGKVAVVENVELGHVADGDYGLIAFPVNYGSFDGAPVRAVLIDNH